ncbi:MoaD/ThiS family protein [Novosphingobium rosa]|uniref:MoaD/ThiS family protein n=1 Tax=Novosphingobium rosa TaxID=76978 RepID=UPI00083193D7|nr:MoaD/ThiS family protein [Novosphingobium rosa]
MSVRLVFLGRLADVAGVSAKEVAPGPLTDLLRGLPAGLLSPRVKLALNGMLVQAEGLVLDSGDELAFLPPVSGG